MDNADLLGFLRQALASPLGIVVETPDVGQLRTDLYAVRRTAGREREKFDALSLFLSPVDDNHLWIVKKAQRGRISFAKSGVNVGS